MSDNNIEIITTNSRANYAKFKGVPEVEIPLEKKEEIEKAVALIFSCEYLRKCEKLMQIAFNGFILEKNGQVVEKEALAFVESLKATKELSLKTTNFTFDHKAHCVQKVEVGTKYG